MIEMYCPGRKVKLFGVVRTRCFMSSVMFSFEITFDWNLSGVRLGFEKGLNN